MLEFQVDIPTMAEEEESFRQGRLEDELDMVQLPAAVAVEMSFRWELLEAGNP